MTKEEYQEKLKEKAKLETKFFKLFIDLFIEYPELKTKEFSKDHIAKIFDKNSFFEKIEAKIKSMSNGLIMKECLKKYGVFMGDSYEFDIRDENGKWQDEWKKLYGEDDDKLN